MSKVTVVIPNYNGIKFIDACLESLCAQTVDTPDTDVIVVDNGSTDDSAEIVRDKYPQVRLELLPENTGFCHAVNVGISMSETEYVILLNNDTIVSKDFVKNLYRAIEDKPEAFSVSSLMLMWDKPELVDDAGDNYNVLGWAYGRGKGKGKEAYQIPCACFSACGGAAIYRKAVFDEIGLFDENHFAYLEDLDIGYRALLYGYRNYYEPSATVIHYGSASSGSRYNEWKTGLASANNLYVIRKNMPLLQRIWNLPFFMIGFFVKYLFFCKKKMGKTYLKGLRNGFTKSYSKAGREKKIRFRWKRIGNYLYVQGLLYVNTFKFLKKS